MTALAWDQVGERLYETGVDHGVLYIPDEGGEYANGYAWNGLTTVTESPTGAEASPQYADNIKYLNLISAEQFGGTIEAFTYPDEFAQCDGTATPSDGVAIGQQSRKVFGLAYRTQLGNDLEGTDYGYKLHLIYGAQAAPSEKAYATINDSPEAISFSWEISTTPVAVSGFKPTASLVIDSSKVDAGTLEDLETILYGTIEDDARLPLPDEVIALFEGAEITETAVPDVPTFDDETNIVTIPTVTHVVYKNNVTGATLVSGAQAALAEDEQLYVKAVAAAGYRLPDPPPYYDVDWLFTGVDIS